MNEQELSISERHTPSQMQSFIYGAFLGNLWYMYQQVGRWVRMGKPGRASPEIWITGHPGICDIDWELNRSK